MLPRMLAIWHTICCRLLLNWMRLLFHFRGETAITALANGMLALAPQHPQHPQHHAVC